MVPGAPRPCFVNVLVNLLTNECSVVTVISATLSIREFRVSGILRNILFQCVVTGGMTMVLFIKKDKNKSYLY